MSMPSRRRVKQISDALRSLPGEADSLSSEARRFDDWLDKQPDWIIRRGREIEDWYSSRYSESELVLATKEILERDLKQILRGNQVLDYRKIPSNYPLKKNSYMGLPKRSYNYKTKQAVSPLQIKSALTTYPERDTWEFDNRRPEMLLNSENTFAEAEEFQNWVRTQPEWIRKRADEISSYWEKVFENDIDAQIKTKRLLKNDLLKIAQGRLVLNYDSFSPRRRGADLGVAYRSPEQFFDLPKYKTSFPVARQERSELENLLEQLKMEGIGSGPDVSQTFAPETDAWGDNVYYRKTSLAIKDSTNMSDQQLQESKAVIDGIMNTYFSKKEIQDFQDNNVSMEIKKLPPDIAGQSEGNKIYLDPETVMRADGVTEDVVVHELVHAYNRFRENENPNVYLRQESMSSNPSDVQKDIEIEEAVTEAITASRLGKNDAKGIPVPKERGSLTKRYMKKKEWQDIIAQGFEFEGMTIINPMYDETLRFRVNPVEYYGKAYMDYQKSLKDAGMENRFLSAFLIKAEMQEFERDSNEDTQDAIEAWAKSTRNKDPYPDNERVANIIIDAMRSETDFRQGAEYTAEMLIGGNAGMGLYELNAIPIMEQMIPLDDIQRTDERAGQVYDLNDAYIVVVEQDNRGRLERDIVGVYASAEAATRAEDVLIANMRDAQMQGRDLGQFEVYTQLLEGNDAFEMYRRWPYIHKTDGNNMMAVNTNGLGIDGGTDVVWLKKGVYGEKMIYKALNEDPSRMRVKTVNWLEDDIEDQDWRDQVYYRNLSGAKYRGSKRAYNKGNAQAIARQARLNGFNARVIPTAKGHRIYLARRKK